MGVYDYVIKNGKGEDVAMSDYKGKVLLIADRRPEPMRRSISSARSSIIRSSRR